MINTPSRTSRRDFLRVAGLGLGGAGFNEGLLTGHCVAAEPVAKAGSTPLIASLNRFPRMMQDWLAKQVRDIEAQGNLRRAVLKTQADAEAYVKSAQGRIRECFGPAPEKTPLNARVMGVVEREVFRIEKTIFESRPGFFVTSNLYVPKGCLGPRRTRPGRASEPRSEGGMMARSYRADSHRQDFCHPQTQSSASPS